MPLTYPGRTFPQSIKQRYRAMGRGNALVVVEGPTDRKTLLPMVKEGTRIVAGNGRDMVLDAYRELKGAGFDRCLFIVDCDNNFPADMKGQSDLIVTMNRDIESDSLFELEGYNRIAFEYLDVGDPGPEELATRRQEVLDFACELCCKFGLVKDVARMRGLPLRLPNPMTGQRVRVTPADLPSVGGWVASQEVPSFAQLVVELSRLLSWGNAVTTAVAVDSERLWYEPCGRHHQTCCGKCRTRALCNGHDLVSALAVDLSIRLTFQVSSRDLDRLVRIGVDRELVSRWGVGRRIRAWEDKTSVPVLHPARFPGS